MSNLIQVNFLATKTVSYVDAGLCSDRTLDKLHLKRLPTHALHSTWERNTHFKKELSSLNPTAGNLIAYTQTVSL